MSVNNEKQPDTKYYVMNAEQGIAFWQSRVQENDLVVARGLFLGKNTLPEAIQVNPEVEEAERHFQELEGAFGQETRVEMFRPENQDSIDQPFPHTLVMWLLLGANIPTTTQLNAA